MTDQKNTLPTAIRDALDAKDQRLGEIITEMMGLRGNPLGLETAIEKANQHLHDSDNVAVATKIAQDFAPKVEEKAPEPAKVEAKPETKPEPPKPVDTPVDTPAKPAAGKKSDDHRL